MRTPWRVVAVVALAVPAAAQPEAQPEARPSVRFSRADMAEVYLGVERAYRAHPPEPEAVAEINRAFDRATLQFFTSAEAIRTMRETTDRLRFGDEVTPNQMFASSLKVSVRPAVLNQEKPEPVTVMIEPMYPAQPVGAVTVRISSPTGRVVFEKPTTEPRATFNIDASKYSIGTYRVQIVAGDEPQFTARWVVSDRSLSAVRDELLTELARADKAPVQALAACRARVNLLNDRPNLEDSTQFLTDPIDLRNELVREVSAIIAGDDPYKGRKGDHWRVFSYRGVDIPCRAFAPTAIADALPVVIVLHGAGGDENMSIDGYGAGVLKSLAERNGFLLISPRTEMLLGNAPVFDALLEAVGEAYPIDRSRIYLVGHSLGAMTATGLCAQRPNAIAAACLIGGIGRFAEDATVPPTLVITGELDPLMRVDQVRAGVNKARQAGQPVELRVIKGRGHTLLVGEQLPDAVAWLLKHHR